MKSVFSIFLTVMAMFSVSDSFAGGGRICHIENRPVYCRAPRGRVYVCGHRPVRVCTGACAPAVESANIGAVEAVLTKLATQDASFANAKKFQAKVAEISAESDAGVKFGAYLDLVGLQSDPSNEDLMRFIGARTADAEAVAHLEKSLELNSDQATRVVNEVATALKGNLQ